jgi:hypothetical protein
LATSAAVDEQGIGGNALSCFLVATPDYSVLFTGDTQYPEKWNEKTWEFLKHAIMARDSSIGASGYLAYACAGRQLNCM